MNRLLSIVLHTVPLSLPAAAAAPNPQALVPGAWLASTTSEGPAGALAFADDSDVLRVQPGSVPLAVRSDGHWLAVLGLVPGDIDALAFVPGVPADRHDALAFSLLSNEGGVLDGDVVTIGPGGGLTVLVAEAAFAAALGTPGASIDVDALAFDSQGRLCFSLQNDLAGTSLGPVLDGDVVRLEPGGGATLVLSEADVAIALSAATGTAAAPGDVQGLAFDSDVPLVLVLSPSEFDGAVLRCGPAPTLVATESELGLGGAELDALEFLPSLGDTATFAVEPQMAAPGQIVTASLVGGHPGHPIVVMSAGTGGWLDTSYLPGFGALALDVLDPWFLLELATAFPGAVLDGAGAATDSFALPASLPGGLGLGGEPGWSYQALDLITLEMLTPFRVGL